MNLTEFLFARIAEDKAAIYHCDSDGEFRAAWVSFYRPDGSLGYTTVAADHADDEWCADGSNLRADTRWHMKVDTPFFDAKRALADCEAKRRTVELHKLIESVDSDGDDLEDCAICEPANLNDWRNYPCETLKLLALPYTDHPDYRDEWRV